jgi:riboflavin synthase
MATVVAVQPEGASLRGTFRAPAALAGFIAPKGSVALNGTSLTVNAVAGTDFGINFIPHTLKATTWGTVAVGDAVNLEVDTLARYVARLREWAAA